MASFQFTNGFLDESLNPSINSRTRDLRSSNFVNSFSNSSANPPASPPSHSGGISSASGHIELSGNASIRLSHGSNDAHPVTHAYTSLRPNTPLSGASGKLHFPALKQYPWSMKLTVNFRSRPFFQNAACRPFALHVHLSSASAPAKSRTFRTCAIADSGR